MGDSATKSVTLYVVDPVRLALVADGLAAAVAVSLPWSTSATAILVGAWFVALLPTLEVTTLRREILSPAGGLPVILTALAMLGMSWAEVSFSDRVHGLEGYLKLLFIPVLFAQFRRSARGWWVILGFLAASLVLLATSWGLATIPDLSWRGKMLGVPVKDYISQSSVFALCAFSLLGFAADRWRSGQSSLALVSIAVAALFIANIVFVETSRTTLVTIAVLVLLFGFWQLGWSGLMIAGLVGCVLAGALWMSSPYLRERVINTFEELQAYRTGHAATSSGVRLEYWKNSIGVFVKSPTIGNGTGSIPEQLVSTVSPETGIESFGTVNPHNEIFVVAVQLGLIGITALLAMWIAHLGLFWGNGPLCWIGLIAVVQNITGSVFNSHLSDFTHGWIYVFVVGVIGGMVLRQIPPQPANAVSSGVSANEAK